MLNISNLLRKVFFAQPYVEELRKLQDRYQVTDEPAALAGCLQMQHGFAWKISVRFSHLEENKMGSEHRLHQMQQCIRNCLECHRVCTVTIAHVLHGGHSDDEAPHLVALLDCAQMCLLHADFMARNSPHQSHVAKECAEICTACAVLCEAHPDPDGQMKACAQTCRECAESCATM